MHAKTNDKNITRVLYKALIIFKYMTCINSFFTVIKVVIYLTSPTCRTGQMHRFLSDPCFKRHKININRASTGTDILKSHILFISLFNLQQYSSLVSFY